MSVTDGAPTRVIGRYTILGEIASGGMATVYLGRLEGTGGFARSVAIKRLHAHLAKDPEFVGMFLDEARLCARIRHPNVVPVLDVVNADGEVFLVMEYVAGDSLARLLRGARERKVRIPVSIAASMVVGVLGGLHAAHEATDERGQPLCIVHRDVSPQNILVGRDGVAHLLDFGVAKVAGKLQSSRSGRVKGKVSYMPPEQARGAEVTRAVDIYAAGVVLWELLTGEQLFAGDSEASVLERVLFGEVVAPSQKEGPADLDEIVMRAIARDPAERFPTAREMARAIESAVSVASTSEVSEWLEQHAPRPVAPSLPEVGSGVRPSSTHDASRSVAPESRTAAWAPWMVIVGVVLLAGGVAASRWIHARNATPSASAAPQSPPIVPSAVAPSAGDSPPAVAPVASASTEAASAPAPRSTVTRPAAPPPPRVVRDACNPPYTVGRDGVKQYKVQCL